MVWRQLLLASFVMHGGMGLADELSPEQVEERTAAIRQAANLGLTRVQTAARNYAKHRDCFSCHHQTLPMLAMNLAQRKGLPVDTDLLRAQAQFTWDTFDRKRKVLQKGRGIGGAAMTVGYGLWALHIAEWTPDDTTSAMVDYLLTKQRDSGAWQCSSHRPPLEESHLTATILAIYYAEKFATPEHQEPLAAAREQAKRYVVAHEPKVHEDLVSQLGALALLRAEPEKFAAVRTQVLQAQQDDGSWSPAKDLPGDAYATGFTLFTLQRVRVPVSNAAFQRGIDYLLRTQENDGSWRLETRSDPIQEFFDNGDPHEEHQFISVAATSWATAALALALPERPAP